MQELDDDEPDVDILRQERAEAMGEAMDEAINDGAEEETTGSLEATQDATTVTLSLTQPPQPVAGLFPRPLHNHT